VAAVAETIHDMDEISSQVAQSADQQRAATAEIMASAIEAASHTREVAEAAVSVLGGADLTGVTARKVSELSAMVCHDIAALQRRLNVILRSSIGGNRRSVDRVPVAIPFTADFAGQTFTGHTGDVSTMGALLVVGHAPKLEGEIGRVVLDGVGSFQTRAILSSPLGIQCQFLKVSAEQKRAVTAAIEAAKAKDAPFIARAQALAAEVAAAFDRAVRDGRISLADLFNSEYTPVEGTDPLQLIARHTALTDAVLPGLIEPALAADSMGVVCCVTDRNGYIATHNRIYSEPQRAGDVVWNTAHSRNRRIFDDRSGILAARNLRPFLVQTYVRDMGGGEFMLLKEIDCPIMLDKRHWGAVRYGIRL
jgi:hypothetical protein